MSKKNLFITLISLLVLLLTSILLYYFLFLKPQSVKDMPIQKRTEIGIIKEISNESEYGTIYIERDDYKAYVSVNKNTIITEEKSKQKLSFKDLKVGDNVKVSVPEIIIEIYPYQYATERIIILK